MNENIEHNRNTIEGKTRCTGHARVSRFFGTSKLSMPERYYLILCFVIYMFWMFVFISRFYGPDEYMRFNIPKFILENKALPYGWEESLRDPNWGISYGFDIAMPYLLSACFMWIASLFTQSEISLLLAARLTSALSMVGAGYFAIQLSRKVFGENPLRWIFIVLSTLLPQIVFLGSYVNLDSFSYFTALMIVYCWLDCMEQKWSIRSTSLLAIALGLCLLSYKFAYGFVLMTLFLYIAWHIAHRTETSFKSFILKGLLVLAIVFVVCGWKFIRNAVIYDGDFLSLSASQPYAEAYALEAYKPSLRVSLKDQGIGPLRMLEVMPWTVSTYESLIGIFGYMYIRMPEWFYSSYQWLFGVGIIGMLIKLAIAAAMPRKFGFKRDAVIAGASLFLASLVTLTISIYFSWCQDYQAQGRYIITFTPLLFLVTSNGLSEWIDLMYKIPVMGRVNKEGIQKSMVFIVCLFVFFSMIAGFYACLCEIAYAGQPFP